MSARTLLTDRDRLFQQIADLLKETLPPELRAVRNATQLGRNFMRLRFPELPKTLYELQFATDHSVEHARYFGPGEKDILALYYQGPAEECIVWLKTLAPLAKSLTEQTKTYTAVGPWGRNWAFLGLNLRGWNFGSDPRLYAAAMERFIRFTYPAALQALRSMRI